MIRTREDIARRISVARKVGMPASRRVVADVIEAIVDVLLQMDPGDSLDLSQKGTFRPLPFGAFVARSLDEKKLKNLLKSTGGVPSAARKAGRVQTPLFGVSFRPTKGFKQRIRGRK